MSKVAVEDKVAHFQNTDKNAVGIHSYNKQQSKPGQEYAKLLYKLGIELTQGIGTEELYKKIVDAARTIMGSQFATMQILCAEPGSGGKLHLVASHGFSPEAEKYWEWVYHYTDSSCGEVLRTRRRVVVSDYRTCEFMQNTPTLSVFIEGGVLAAQSTPLYSSKGKLLGMMSTHWSSPHTPAPQQLDLLDLLADQAAELVERTQK